MKADAEIEEMFRDLGVATERGRRLLTNSMRIHFSKTFVAQLIDRINVLKAGRSLRRESVRRALELYCEGLSVDDKATVLNVVKELVRVSQTDPIDVFQTNTDMARTRRRKRKQIEKGRRKMR